MTTIDAEEVTDSKKLDSILGTIKDKFESQTKGTSCVGQELEDFKLLSELSMNKQ